MSYKWNREKEEKREWGKRQKLNDKRSGNAQKSTGSKEANAEHEKAIQKRQIATCKKGQRKAKQNTTKQAQTAGKRLKNRKSANNKEGQEDSREPMQDCFSSTEPNEAKQKKSMLLLTMTRKMMVMTMKTIRRDWEVLLHLQSQWLFWMCYLTDGAFHDFVFVRFLLFLVLLHLVLKERLVNRTTKHEPHGNWVRVSDEEMVAKTREARERDEDGDVEQLREGRQKRERKTERKWENGKHFEIQ